MDLNLDDIDRRILNTLQRDAGLSVDEVADSAGLSRNACWRRIKKLEEANVIDRRVAILNPVAVGLGMSVFVLVRTNRHDADWLALFDKAVKQLPEIIGAHRMAGELDYILRVRVGSMGEYDEFYQRLIARVPLSDISASFVMDDIKDTTVLPI